MAKQIVDSFIQEVYNKPRKVLVGAYLTKKGKRLEKLPGTTVGELKKYTKNRYKIDPTAKVIRLVVHQNKIQETE